MIWKENDKSTSEILLKKTIGIAKSILNRCNIEDPKILPLEDGSLDIIWKNSLFRLIINCYYDENTQFEMQTYGHSMKGYIKGKNYPNELDLTEEKIDPIINWIDTLIPK